MYRKAPYGHLAVHSWSWRLARAAGAEEVHGGEREDGLVVLGDQLDVAADEAAVGLGPGAARLDRGDPQLYRVAGPQRGRPAELVDARRGEAGRPGQVVIGEQP